MGRGFLLELSFELLLTLFSLKTSHLRGHCTFAGLSITLCLLLVPFWLVCSIHSRSTPWIPFS